ncbi:hypothetical protein F5Y18DRAFT_440514 [Xylariaceae sp. FL1019]|nr:hypothetical protein F5Y18DRAFT_440514 [Xylariaceae sp. FL1019]
MSALDVGCPRSAALIQPEDNDTMMQEDGRAPDEHTALGDDLIDKSDSIQVRARPPSERQRLKSLEWRKKNYWRKRDLGQCTYSSCTNLTVNGRHICSVHKQPKRDLRALELKRKRYWRKRASGQCVHSPTCTNPAENGHIKCMAHFNTIKPCGKCTDCGGPFLGNQSYCDACIRKMGGKKKSSEKETDIGHDDNKHMQPLCYIQRCKDTATDGMVNCPYHRAANNITQWKYQARQNGFLKAQRSEDSVMFALERTQSGGAGNGRGWLDTVMGAPAQLCRSARCKDVASIGSDQCPYHRCMSLLNDLKHQADMQETPLTLTKEAARHIKVALARTDLVWEEDSSDTCVMEKQ